MGRNVICQDARELMPIRHDIGDKDDKGIRADWPKSTIFVNLLI